MKALDGGDLQKIAYFIFVIIEMLIFTCWRHFLKLNDESAIIILCNLKNRVENIV